MKKELKQFKTTQLRKSNQRLKAENNYPKELKIVAEGDSWFDYPLKKDIIDYLRKKGFAIKNFAVAGDTLENMVYGTKYKFKRGKIKYFGPISLQTTLNAVKEHNPRFVLFSAGGNDVVGSTIISYLNHKNSKPNSLINKKIFKCKLEGMKTAIEYFIKSVKVTDPNIDIIMDGYDYARVNGKGYSFVFKNIKGPWLLPSMAEKGIINKKEQKESIKYFVDKFNEMLIDLANKHNNFNHIDLRGVFANDNEWDNEIHLKNKGFRKIADLYHEKMNELLGDDPIAKNTDRIIA